MIAFNRARAPTSSPNTELVKLTCCICRNTSSPKHTMITAAMLTPPAPTCTAWNRTRTRLASVVANQGCSLSTARPTKGAMHTPSMPTRPKRPMTSLCACVRRNVVGGKVGGDLRVVEVGWTAEEEGQSHLNIKSN